MTDFEFETARERRQRVELEAERFRRFRTLWADYQAALRVPFSLDRTEDERIKTEVERCFEALNQLAKEGT